MSKLHLAPRTGFYTDIHFVNPISGVADASGLVGYKNGSKNAGNSTLAVSVRSGSLFTFKPLVHTISAAQGSGITVSQEDGIVTLDANGGGTGEIQVIKVTVPKDSASVTSDGVCYANVGVSTSNGFVYRAYDKVGDPVAVAVSKNNADENYVTIDFDSSTAFTTLNSAVYIDIIVGTTAPHTVNSGTTAPTPI
jgi:hypothetical protein